MESDDKKKIKNSKKDKLSGALKKEVAKSGLSGFIRDRKSNKKEEDGSSSQEELISVKEDSSGNYGLEKPKMGFKFKKIALLISICLLFGFLYYTFLRDVSYRKIIYLSSQPINVINLGSLNQGAPVFSMSKPIYVHFSMGSSLDVDNIHIQIINVVSNVEHIIGTVSATVRPEWKHVQTHFQEEYFDKVGEYKIKVLNPNKKLLSEKEFRIK